MAENLVLTEAVYYILLTLTKPLHGYGIMQKVEQLSHGRLNLAAGTLYGALSTLLSRGWIAELPVAADSRRKEYVLTPIGHAALTVELSRLEELVENGRRIIQKGTSHEHHNQSLTPSGISPAYANALGKGVVLEVFADVLGAADQQDGSRTQSAG